MRNKSFTLIELLVVIVIIGILAGVIMISTSSSIDKANFAKAQAFSSTVQEELLSNLVSEWTFDNTSSPREDTWGNNDGALAGTTFPSHQLASSNNCVFGSCYNFSGAGYINCGNNNSLQLKDVITLSAWTKRIQGELTHRIIHKGGQTNTSLDYTIYFSSDETFRFNASKTTGNTFGKGTTKKFPIDEWLYVVGTFDGGNYKIYVNGIQETSLFDNNTSNTSSNIFAIGSRNDASVAQFMNGLIDDVRIYNAALSSAQIKQNYIAGLNSMLSNGSISKEEYNKRINTLAYDK